MVTEPELTYDEHTALVVVDVQNDLADPRGGLYVEGGDELVAVVNDLVRSARSEGALVVYTQDWHPETTPHFEKDGGVWPVHCVAETWGAELHPDLDVVGPVVRKGTGGEDGYSGFTARDVTTGEDKPTELQDVLSAREVTDLVVVGLAQDVCVKETVLDAVDLGYRTIVPTVATRPVDDEDGRGAIDAMRKAGAQVV